MKLSKSQIDRVSQLTGLKNATVQDLLESGWVYTEGSVHGREVRLAQHGWRSAAPHSGWLPARPAEPGSARLMGHINPNEEHFPVKQRTRIVCTCGDSN